MVKRASDRLLHLRLAGEVTAFGESTASRVLEEDLADSRILSAPTYSMQAVQINARMWSRMFKQTPPPVRIVNLGLEEVTCSLLARDIRNPNSLVHRLFFIPQVRDILLTRLDCARACWKLDNLERRLREPTTDPASDGTVFFWGLTDQGRRVPLTLTGPAAAAMLAGIDGRGRRWEWEFTPDAMAAALSAGELIPSLTTCFAALAFARGIACVGGPYQAEYLPVMQRGVADAVRAEDPAAATLIAQVPTRLCLADMHVVMRLRADGLGIPAGPVEISGTGGITASDLAAIASGTAREAYLAAFPDMFPRVAPGVSLPDRWVEILARENVATCPSIAKLSDVDPLRKPSMHRG
jgi:hypothetical protein